MFLFVQRMFCSVLRSCNVHYNLLEACRSVQRVWWKMRSIRCLLSTTVSLLFYVCKHQPTDLAVQLACTAFEISVMIAFTNGVLNNEP